MLVLGRSFPGRSCLLAAVLLLLSQSLAAGIWLSQLSGTCIDAKGQPLAGAIVRFRSPSNGRQFEVKTDASGTFFYIAANPDLYSVQLILKGKQLAQFDGLEVRWSSRPVLLRFDLQHNTATITLQTLTPEVFGTLDSSPQLPHSLESDNKDAATAEAINQKLAEAKQRGDQGDWVGAIAVLHEAAAIDPSRAIPWGLLGQANWRAAQESPETTRRFLQPAAQAYEKAIGLEPSGAYHNNLGQVYVSLNRLDDALQQFQKAKKIDPGAAATYEFNIGVVLFQQSESQTDSHPEERLHAAAEAFGEVSALRPEQPQPYYLRGICLLRLAANHAPGASYSEVAAVLQHYLALAPNGPFAAEVKSMLQSLGELNIEQR